MLKIDYKKEYETMMNTEDNTFKIGDYVCVDKICDTEGNEIDSYDQRRDSILVEGKIDFVFGNDFDGGYVYGIEGSKHCFNKFELKFVE